MIAMFGIGPIELLIIVVVLALVIVVVVGGGRHRDLTARREVASGQVDCQSRSMV